LEIEVMAKKMNAAQKAGLAKGRAKLMAKQSKKK